MQTVYNNASVLVAQLTQQQVTLLITSMCNSAPVRDFKLRLASEFYEMRKELTAPKSLDRRSLALMMVELEDVTETVEHRATV